MIECPIIYFTKNLVFGKDKSCWAIYEATGYDYELLSNELKINMLNRLTRFISGIQVEAKILIIPVKQNNKEHFENLKNKIINDENLQKEKNDLLEATESYLNESLEVTNNVNDYRTYVIVKLILEEEIEYFQELKEMYDYFIKNPIKAINVFMNLGTHDILESKIKTFKNLADKFCFDNNNRLELKPINTAKTQWILRRTMFRGLEKDVNLFYKSNREEWQPFSVDINIDSEKIVKPYYKDTINLFSGTIRKKRRYIEIEQDNKDISYQTFLAITNVPDVMEFPSCEWIYMLQKYNSQAEICIHIRNIEHKDSIRKISFKKREANAQIENIISANSDIPNDLLETKLQSEELENELKTGRLPVCKTSVSICVSSDNLETLEKKADTIKREYEDLHFIVERPLTDQLKMFFQFFPSVGHGVKDFVMNLTPTVIASGIFGASRLLGDDVGHYIGTTGQSAKQVFLDLGLACRMNKSACATFFGNLGFGKSFNANLLAHINFISGGYNLILDPKGERSHWVDFPLYKDYINVITLTADRKFQGMLDPYNIYSEDVIEANNLALNIISEYYQLVPQDAEYLVLLDSFSTLEKKVTEDKITPSMQELCNIIENFDDEDNLKNEANNLSRRLRLLRQGGLSQLIFGTGVEKSITLDNRINILQIQNLSLPSPNTEKKDYTQEEVLSTVLMMIISNFAKKFALKKRKEFSLILFDESWMLGKTTEGVKLYDFLARMGRSLYTGCIFNGHSVLDIPTEGIKNTITYKFCFNTGIKEEAKRMLEYLNLEVTPINIDLIQSLRNGQCLFQDAFRRVGILTFDAVFQDVIDLFSTTPVTDDDIISNVKETNDKNILEHEGLKSLEKVTTNSDFIIDDNILFDPNFIDNLDI